MIILTVSTLTILRYVHMSQQKSQCPSQWSIWKTNAFFPILYSHILATWDGKISFLKTLSRLYRDEWWTSFVSLQEKLCLKIRWRVDSVVSERDDGDRVGHSGHRPRSARSLAQLPQDHAAQQNDDVSILSVSQPTPISNILQIIPNNRISETNKHDVRLESDFFSMPLTPEKIPRIMNWWIKTIVQVWFSYSMSTTRKSGKWTEIWLVMS